MLSALADIKKLRERNAQAEALRKRQLLTQSREKVEEAQRDLQQFEIWRVQEEHRLYDSIMGSEVGLKAIDKVKHQIGMLRLKEVSLAEQVEKARQEQKQAEAALRQAEQALAEAGKAVEKCQMLIEQVSADAIAEAQRLEELELEEASETNFSRPQN
ncbi:putative type III secretion protein YscO [Hahella chejuensis KCTC 2396]|uniref:Putative type III secretion protein YscO n=1 Tax=Hahella chejuensis (strain KCTC 2396) TaxID=349521 RepID=Q2SC35_HAHCH|nr:type III secretion protein [Hahella chejuensis]ABC31789.1 putative type III secretion protein YscO [Hahella chejuensis KCTC 2396]